MVGKSHSLRLPILMKTLSTQVSLKDYSVRFHEYPSSWSRVDTREKTLTKMIVSLTTSVVRAREEVLAGSCVIKVMLCVPHIKLS
jgi:hypothetical protein